MTSFVIAIGVGIIAMLGAIVCIAIIDNREARSARDPMQEINGDVPHPARYLAGIDP